MSIKSTRSISRLQAMYLLNRELPNISNKLLEDVLDTIADSGHSGLSIMDNFRIFDNYTEEEW